MCVCVCECDVCVCCGVCVIACEGGKQSVVSAAMETAFGYSTS